MRFFPSFKHSPSPNPSPMPPWLRLGVVAFILAVVFYSGLHSKEGLSKLVTATSQTAEKTPEAQDAKRPALELPNYNALLFPANLSGIRVREIKRGSGPIAICGQTAVIRYAKQMQVTSNASEATPNEAASTQESALELTYRIGDSKIEAALSMGILGMQAGGVREISIPETIATSNPSPDDAHTAQLFHVTLRSLAPDISALMNPASDTLPLKQFDTGFGRNKAASCGDEVLLHIRLWNADGSPRFNSAKELGKPVRLRIGSGENPAGLDQSLIGMMEGGRRIAIIPPAWQKPFSSSSSEDKAKKNAVQKQEVLHKLTLPGTGVTTAEIVLLAVNPPEEPTPMP